MKCRGFTLIELVIAVSIGLLMIGVGTVYFNNFNAKQRLKTTKSELVALLKQARSFAKTQQQPGTLMVAYNFVGLLVNNQSQVEVGVNCETSPCSNIFFQPKEIASEEITISRGVVRFAPFSGKLLVWNALTSSWDAANSGVTFTISSEEIADTETTVVSKWGQIDEE